MTYPRLFRARAGLTALLALAACTDANPTDPRAAPPAAGEPVTTALNCDVDLARTAMRCAESAPAGGGGASYAILLGKQGTYVRLSSSGMAYDPADSIFSMEVTVQSLISQQMGTPDGVTVAGLKVFFYELPVAMAGSGPVAVANPDGYATFTAAGQPYFEYPQIVETLGRTAPRTWRFKVPPAVTHFRFSVLVETTLPAESRGALRWAQERGALAVSFHQVVSVWGTSAHSIYALSESGILHYDGTRWDRMHLPFAVQHLRDLTGASPHQVYAVGLYNRVLRYDGNRWHDLRPANGARSFESVWAGGKSVVAAGDDRSGQSVLGLVSWSNDEGATWTDAFFPSTGRLYLKDAWRDGPNIYAVGSEEGAELPRPGIIVRSSDGGQTWTRQVMRGWGDRQIRSITGGAAGELIAAGGQWDHFKGRWDALILRSTDQGTTWSESLVSGGNGRLVYDLWRAQDGTIYGVGWPGTVLVWNGTQWSDRTLNSSLRPGLSGIWGSSASNLVAVAYDYQYWFNGTTWTESLFAVKTQERLMAVSGDPDGEAFAAGYRVWGPSTETGVILRRTPEGWVQSLVGADSTRFTDVYSPAPGEAWALWETQWWGGAGLRRFDGTAWQTVAPPGYTTPMQITGTGPEDVHLFGYNGPNRWVTWLRTADRGASWTTTNVPVPEPGVLISDARVVTPKEIWLVGRMYSPAGMLPFTLRYDGSTWTMGRGQTDEHYRAVWTQGSYVAIAGTLAVGSTQQAFLRTSSDGGATWTQTAVPGMNGRYISALWGTSPTNLYGAVVGGGVMHYNGSYWQVMAPAGRGDMHGIIGSERGNVLAVGWEGVILRGTR